MIKHMKVILFLFIVISHQAHSNSNESSMQGWSFIQPQSTLKQSSNDLSVFNYDTETQGESFSLVSVSGSISPTLACDGLTFNDATNQISDQLDRMYQYAASNWESIVGNYVIFSQPQIAATIENTREALSFDLSATLANCQYARELAMNSNAEEWAKHQKNADCLNASGGEQLSCLSNLGDDRVDGPSGTVIEARAQLNDFIAQLSQNSNGKKTTGNNSRTEFRGLYDTCLLGDVNSEICQTGSLLVQEFKVTEESITPEIIEPKINIAKHIETLDMALREGFISLIEAAGPQQKEKRDHLYKLSFGQANISNDQINKLRELYKTGRKAEFSNFVTRLTIIWSFNATNVVLNRLEFGVSDGMTKTNNKELTALSRKAITAIQAKKKYLKHLEEEFERKKLEESLWETIKDV